MLIHKHFTVFIKFLTLKYAISKKQCGKFIKFSSIFTLCMALDLNQDLPLLLVLNKL